MLGTALLQDVSETQKYVPKIALWNSSLCDSATRGHTRKLLHGCTTTILLAYKSIKSWFKSVCLILVSVHACLLPLPTS